MRPRVWTGEPGIQPCRGGPTLNEQHEPRPTQSSHDPRPGQTTVPTEPPRSIWRTPPSRIRPVYLTMGRLLPEPRPAPKRASRQRLHGSGFRDERRRERPGGDRRRAPRAHYDLAGPRGSDSIDADETLDAVPDDRTTPPTENTSGGRAESRKPAARELGPDLPGYVILDVIGRGGMGVVYKARHIRLDRLVALKMVLAGAHASPEQLARFAIESQAVAQLQHPGIVQIYEVGEHDGLPYFSLEFVAGGSLAKKIGGKPQPTREAAGMVRDLALAMCEAHRRNIIHRDLKPANVLLTPDGQPKITDFGLAKRLDADSQQTHTGAIMGTPSYMAPEQAWGRTHELAH